MSTKVQSSLDDGITWLGRDTAVVATVSCHLDIPLIAPPGTPRILHQVIILSPFATVAHSKNSMVEIWIISSTRRVIDDSRPIELEVKWTGINGNGNWCFIGHSVLKTRFTVSCWVGAPAAVVCWV